MLTKEDLQAIGELFVAEREHTKKLLEVNNTVLSTIIKVELAVTNKRIDANKQDIKALMKGQERIEQKLDQVIEEDHEERISRLEEAADHNHRN